MGCLAAAGCHKEVDLLAPAPSGEQPALHAARSTIPAQFTETRIAETFNQATHMVIAPDGRVFVAEQTGVIRLVKNDVLLSTPFATIPASVIDATGSRGLMGMALSSTFATDRYLYLGFTGKNPSANRIVRIRASSSNPDVAETSSGTLTFHNQFTLSNQGSSSAHNSMSMRMVGSFLYVATGDNQQQNMVQTLTHSAGKILRMNADLTAGTGNPYASNSNAIQARIWGKGMRNPWTMAVSNTGLLYVSDVGSLEGGTPNTNDVPVEEINVIPTTTPRSTELNYGWPSSEGGGANIIHTYPQAAGEDVPGSDCAVVGGSFYQPNATAFPSTPKFPASYNGAYFFGDHCSGKLKYLPAGQQTAQTLNGNPPAASARTPVLFASDTIQGLVQIEASPTGALYYLTRAIIRPRDPNVKGVLLKVTYAGTAIPETCTLTAPAPAGRYTAPASFAMNVTAADATGGGIQKVEFFYTNSNVAGAPQVKAGEDTSSPYSLSLSGLGQNAYRLTARCTNQQGGFKDADPVTVTVNGPTAVIDNPIETLTYNAGDTINFSGTASDPEDGSVAASRYSWFIELGHGIGAGAHYHDVAQFDGVTSGSWTVSRNEELDPNVFQRITLQVQDAAGIYHSVSRDIFPNKTDVTVTTSPPGLTVSVDAIDRIGPVTFQSVVGMERLLSAPAQQVLNGRRYQFSGWSQGGAAAQTWLVTGGNPTITASYTDVGPAAPTLTSQDIGAVAATGTYNLNATTGVYTIEGSGADVWSTADEFRFSHTALTGDGTITARVVSLENTHSGAKAGVMMRDGTGANVRNFMAFITPTSSNGFRVQRRVTAGATTLRDAADATTSINTPPNNWVRLERTGNVFRAYYSANGTAWTALGPAQTLALPSTLRVGLAVTSHADGTLATAVFDNVSIGTPPPPTPPGVPGTPNCTAGNGQCACSWAASSGATSYNVKRSLTSGSGFATVNSPTGTSYTNTGLTNGTTYYYVVSAVNGAGESNNGTQVACTPMAPLPGAPPSLVATAGNGQVALSWSASSGATSYTVKRGLASGGPYTDFTQAGITGTSYTNTGLANGTTYFYVVTASNLTGESGNSNQASATPQPPPPPSAPGSLTASGGDARVVLGWNAVSGASSYTVKRAVDSGGPYTDFIAPGVTGTSYTDTTLIDNGVTYFYVVTASNSNGESGNSNQASATPQPPPAPPAGLAATAGNAQVSLSWSASAGATSYRVKRSTTAGSGYASVQAGLTGTSFIDTGRTNGVTYYYVVTASTNLAESGDSAEASATPQPAAPGAPTGVTATAGNAQVVIGWSAVSGATSYTVKRATTSGGPYTDVGTGITVTSFTNTGLTNGTAYHYVVSASNGGGQGPNSSQVSATPASGPTWFQVNVGGATPEGSYTVSGGTHTIVGGGADFQGNATAGQADQFKWVYREITGNATITVRLASLANVGTQTFVKGGVMMRASTSTTSMYASALITNTAANDFRYQRRLTNGAAVTQDRGNDSAIPGWVRLVKNGNTITAFSSTNGTTWTQIGTAQTIALPSTYQIGFAVTSHQQGTSTTAVFDNVTITQ